MIIMDLDRCLGRVLHGLHVTFGYHGFHHAVTLKVQGGSHMSVPRLESGPISYDHGFFWEKRRENFLVHKVLGHMDHTSKTTLTLAPYGLHAKGISNHDIGS